MANNLDLQEQEQMDAMKAFWTQYGNVITWLLVLALGAYSAFNGWQWWQRDQAGKASAIFHELERAATAGDSARAARAFTDLKDRYSRTVYAEQAGMLAARVHHDKAELDAARAALAWVVDNAREDAYRDLARVRLAGLMIDAKQFDDALKQLDGVKSATFAALSADRRGDALLAKGDKDAAIKSYETAWKAWATEVEYRQFVEAKLTTLGAAPAAATATGVSR